VGYSSEYASPNGDAPARKQLDEARSLVCTGDLVLARLVCAELIFEQLPRLARNRDLLRDTIATLVHARSFQLLNRLLAAVDGSRFRVALASGDDPATSPIKIGRSAADGTTTFAVSEALFCRPDADAVISRWSAALVARYATTQVVGHAP
jgi:hypothetical protein